jgi:16S rRNA (uracil1498-N3)-methyltransferase
MHDRYFIDCPFKAQQSVTIESQELYHLARVMRASVGDLVECINGRGQLARARIENLGKDSATLLIVSLTEGKSQTKLVLAQALPRFNRLEFILEKGTELGVSEFWLFPGARSEKETLSVNQQQRSHSLLVAAIKQCGRLDLPKVILKESLSECLFDQGSCFFGDVRPKAPKLTQEKVVFPACVFIGPEAGFSDQEVAFLEKKIKARGVWLHDNILRVDTAAIAAVAQLYCLT